MTRNLRLLLLGGTEEGRLLAQRLQGYRGLELIHSLAGRTSNHGVLAGELRRGGFGGACGLGNYLRTHRIDLLLDATHLHAARISRNAMAAARECGVARAQLRRPAWTPHADDDWQQFPSLEAIASALPSKARVFLTIGSGGLEAFASRNDVIFLARCIETPMFSDGKDFQTHFPSGRLLLERGPFALESERALLQEQSIDILVSKNSGGRATWAKILAARELRIPVWMLAPPPPVPGIRVASVEEALTWVRNHLRLGRSTCT